MKCVSDWNPDSNAISLTRKWALSNKSLAFSSRVRETNWVKVSPVTVSRYRKEPWMQAAPSARCPDHRCIYAVQNSPSQPTTFTLDQTAVITRVQDYHYFNSGALPGTIGLRHADGTLYGPWQTFGLPGQGQVSNAYWVAEPFVTLKPGTYTVVDSDTSTWSHNSASGFAGFTLVQGYSPPVFSPMLAITREGDGRLAITWSASFANFALERTAAVGSNSEWIATGAPVVEYGQFIVRIPADGKGSFFRLGSTDSP